MVLQLRVCYAGTPDVCRPIVGQVRQQVLYLTE